MDEGTFAAALQRAAMEIPADALDGAAVLALASRSARRRRAGILASAAGLVVAMGLVPTLIVIGIHSGSPTKAIPLHSPGAVRAGIWAPSCGSPGSIDLTSAATAIPVITGTAGQQVALQPLVHIRRAVTVNDIRLVVSTTPTALPPQPSSSATSPIANSVVTKDFGSALTDGASLQFAPTLPAGQYNVYGVIDYVESAECGGLASETYNTVATLIIS